MASISEASARHPDWNALFEIATVQQGKRPKVHAYVSGLGIRTLLDDR